MPKYMIELNGRDMNHHTSTCIVRDEAGEVIGEYEAIMTEVALLGALRLARSGGNPTLWETCTNLEKEFVEFHDEVE